MPWVWSMSLSIGNQTETIQWSCSCNNHRTRPRGGLSRLAKQSPFLARSASYIPDPRLSVVPCLTITLARRRSSAKSKLRTQLHCGVDVDIHLLTDKDWEIATPPHRGDRGRSSRACNPSRSPPVGGRADHHPPLPPHDTTPELRKNSLLTRCVSACGSRSTGVTPQPGAPTDHRFRLARNSRR